MHGQIDPLGRRVRGFGRQDVLFAQNRRIALDEETGALIVVGDDGFTDDDPFAGLQFDLERHVEISRRNSRGRQPFIGSPDAAVSGHSSSDELSSFMLTEWLNRGSAPAENPGLDAKTAGLSPRRSCLCDQWSA